MTNSDALASTRCNLTLCRRSRAIDQVTDYVPEMVRLRFIVSNISLRHRCQLSTTGTTAGNTLNAS